jgi:PucR C-terminal helix-turn-helix domain
MTSIDAQPWRGLRPEVADLIEPELADVSEEILATIAREVPEYARPLEGKFGRGIQTGVAEALRQFVALIRDPEAGREPGREVYVRLGRGEARQGRTLDSLQAAYRVGARVAWRRIAAAGRRARLDAEVLSLLAEAIFAYIDELSADSVEGFADAQAEVEDLRRRRRRELLEMLLAEPAAEPAELHSAAARAGWELPLTVAALACGEAELGRAARRLPADSLASGIGGIGAVLIADPSGPGRARGIERAFSEGVAVLGPPGTLSELISSWSLARAALGAVEAGALSGGGLIRVDQHLGELMLFESSSLLKRVASQRLGALAGLTPKARQRMEETALAFLRHRGNSVAIGAALHIHPQSARHRVARLRELLGAQLDDPDARFELEAALRAPARR